MQILRVINNYFVVIVRSYIPAFRFLESDDWWSAYSSHSELCNLYDKLYRKNIIRYIRLPIWIIGLLFVIRHTHKTETFLWWISVFTSFMMIGLDHYWENKCDKVIKKYAEK